MFSNLISKTWPVVVGLCVIFIFFIVGYEAADCENAVMWEAIPEDQYDRNSSSVRLGMRPLGFKDDVLPYSPDGLPNPCYRVEGTNGKRVEIMAETHGGLNAKLCVRTQRQDHGCDDGKLYNCEQANANYLNIEFYCDTNGCDQSDTTIWIRFVVSPNEYDNDPEMFCLDRNADEYPSSLIQIPPPSQKPIIPTTDTGSTVKATFTSLIVSCLIAIGIRFA